MELKDYLKITLQGKWLVLLSMLMVGGIAWLITIRQPTKHQGAITVTVWQKEATLPELFTFDSFYSLQSTRLLTDTLAGWLTSPNTTKRIFDQAKVNLTASNVKSLGKIFRQTKSTPESSTVVITVERGQSDETQALLTTAKSELTQHFARLIESKQVSDRFGLSVSDPISIAVPPAVKLNTLVGLMVGLIVGLLVVSARETFNQ